MDMFREAAEFARWCGEGPDDWATCEDPDCPCIAASARARWGAPWKGSGCLGRRPPPDPGPLADIPEEELPI